MLLTFTIFIFKRLHSLIYGFLVYYLVVKCRIKILQLQKNFIYAKFFYTTCKAMVVILWMYIAVYSIIDKLQI